LLSPPHPKITETLETQVVCCVKIESDIAKGGIDVMLIITGAEISSTSDKSSDCETLLLC